jgi:type VI secretion system secreted protein Hcp
MAQKVYLTMKGARSGEVRGDANKDHAIGVMAVSHEITAGRELASGAGTGKRQHFPIRITKEVDGSTPILLQMLATSEVIVSWKLDFFEPNVQGVEKNYYRIELVNAQVFSYKFTQPNSKEDGGKRAGYEEVAFNYQKITWVAVDKGITASDDWDGSDLNG